MFWALWCFLPVIGLACASHWIVARLNKEQHSAAQQRTTRHGTAQRSTAEHSTAQHKTAQHNAATYKQRQQDYSTPPVVKHQDFQSKYWNITDCSAIKQCAIMQHDSICTFSQPESRHKTTQQHVQVCHQACQAYTYHHQHCSRNNISVNMRAAITRQPHRSSGTIPGKQSREQS